MPWKPLSQICRQVEELPFRPTPTAAAEVKGVLACRSGVNPSEISHAALLEVVRLGTPGCLEVLMRIYAREARWLASGRRSPDGEREVIRPDHWAFLTLDIEHQVVRDLDGKLVYADLKGAFGNDLTEEEWQSVRDQLAPPSPAPVPKARGEDTAGPSKTRHAGRKRGRKKGSGSYDSEDMPLIEEMHRLIGAEEAMSPWDAALAVADRAPGKRGIDSKVKRLVRKYEAKYGPDKGHSD